MAVPYNGKVAETFSSLVRSQRLTPFDPRKVGGYDIVDLLGIGGFGKTYLAKKDNKLYALKKINKSTKNAENEIIILRRIAPFCNEQFSCGIEVLDSLTDYFIISQYIDGISPSFLYAKYHQDKNTIFLEYTTSKLIKNVTKALMILHQHGIAHMDIQPKNIIYDTGIDEFRLIDFGISLDLTTGNLKPKGYAPKGYVFEKVLNYRIGESPEIFYQQDIFSLAVTAFYLYEERFPFPLTGNTYNRNVPVYFKQIKSFFLESSLLSMLDGSGTAEKIFNGFDYKL